MSLLLLIISSHHLIITKYNIYMVTQHSCLSEREHHKSLTAERTTKVTAKLYHLRECGFASSKTIVIADDKHDCVI